MYCIIPRWLYIAWSTPRIFKFPSATTGLLKWALWSTSLNICCENTVNKVGIDRTQKHQDHHMGATNFSSIVITALSLSSPKLKEELRCS